MAYLKLKVSGVLDHMNQLRIQCRRLRTQPSVLNGQVAVVGLHELPNPPLLLHGELVGRGPRCPQLHNDLALLDLDHLTLSGKSEKEKPSVSVCFFFLSVKREG